jgi:hypothetical protein
MASWAWKILRAASVASTETVMFGGCGGAAWSLMQIVDTKVKTASTRAEVNGVS